MALHAWFLVGPTAVGKSAVAQWLAEKRKATLVSADSMLVYRGMDIGTAKPSPAERGEVPYWGLDCVEPDQSFSVGDYLRSLAGLAQAESSGRPLIVVGGTGLYIDCLLRGLTSRPPPDLLERARLESLHRQGGVPALQAEVERLAPGRLAELADPRNPRRLIRAIELAHQGVLSKTMLQRGPPKPRLTGLRMDPAQLAGRIARRVQTMYHQGLLEEARALRGRYPALSETARQAIGYAEAWQVLDGTLAPSAAQEITARRTRQLAKRQLTWFRHQADMAWIEAEPGATVARIAASVEAQWELDGPTTLHL